MMVDERPRTPEEVTGRVLRRAEVAKMSRKLQDRLALASYKAKNGLDRLSFSMVEARFESDRQRRGEAGMLSSGSSSPTHSSDSLPYLRPCQSSPITAPIFSDPAYPDGSRTVPRKRTRFQADEFLSHTPATSRKARKSYFAAQSSPAHSQGPSLSLGLVSSPLESRFSSFAATDAPNFSFVSSASTISDSPQLENGSVEEPPMPPVFRGSPPRTPPPSRPRGLRRRSEGVVGEEGADLLLYLATSPSPANAMKSASNHGVTIAPSTPPSNPGPLPSSMINTPGGTHGLFHGFNTPGQAFNFADFCNVTPSPAQGAFSRTPGPSKTPLTGTEARRRLNFDSLLPLGASSPNLTRGRETGLGMELGGELRT